jgi:beta-glucosidase
MNTPEIMRTAYDVASEAIVLLKNEDKLLPLNRDDIDTLAVIGLMAAQKNAKGGFTAGVKARYEITPLEGLKKKGRGTFTLRYAPGYKEEYIRVDTSGRWPHRYPDPSPDQDLIREAVDIAREADYVILFTGNTRGVETEATDRESLSLPFGQDSLIRAVSRVNPRTIIVVVAGAASDLSVADKLTQTVVWSWFNGSEAGHALADMLFGNINPSGKLPFTIPNKLADIGAHALDAYPGQNGTVKYGEGLLVGYRWFDTKQIEPAYCFGHGLSYTQFEIEDVLLRDNTVTQGSTIDIDLKLANTGEMKGKETVQIYCRKKESDIVRPDKELRAFKKVEVEAHTTEKVSFSIPLEKLAYFNVEQMRWRVEPGDYMLLIGTSSRDIRAQLQLSVKD